MAETNGATDFTFSCLSASSADIFNNDDDVKVTSLGATELVIRDHNSSSKLVLSLTGSLLVSKCYKKTRVFLHRNARN